MKKVLVLTFAVMMIACLSLSAFAEVSPTAPVVYDVSVSSYAGGNVNTSYDEETGVYTLVAAANDSNSFSKWEITGDYEIVEGTLESATLKIKCASDVEVSAVFVDENGDVVVDDVQTPDDTVPSTTTPADDSSDAPQTGSNTLSYLALALCVACAVAFISKKQLAK